MILCSTQLLIPGRSIAAAFIRVWLHGKQLFASNGEMQTGGSAGKGSFIKARLSWHKQLSCAPKSQCLCLLFYAI